ncbi:45222_t:CDS:2 [Gigaspora margarita]|uniref:45222_t:CDS:1 n=1 Tax=Gigaspora margarita TaxID=4874 RepID=A0ABN7USG3_GIGMA|nr:45222_t:CDS:2 [Gigaspora margarita]
MGITISYKRSSGDGNDKNDETIINKGNSEPNFDWLDGGKFPTKIEESYRLYARHFALKHDVGCGSGQWSIEIAQMFPDAEIYGIDISPKFPFIAPYNCTFVRGNILCRLSFEDNFFDFIWIRNLYAEITNKDWPPLMHELKRVLKSGGIIEQHESDGLGFENISKTYRSIPLGRWGGRIGEINATNLKQAYLTIQPWLTPFTELTEDEYNRTIKQIVDKELNEYHSYTNHHIILVKKTISGHWWFS